MRRLPLVIGAAFAVTGLTLGLASGGGAQTVDGLDLAKVRERAKLSPEDAEAFGSVVARRGEAVKAQAAASASAARANAVRHARTAAASARPADTFDFDAMVAAASREAASSENAPRLVAFASLSMPAASLRQMIDEVGRAGGVVVFRGFPGNSVKQFTGALARVVPAAGGSNAVGIDPRLFRAFAITTVPTYVVTSTDFDLCDGFDCTTQVPPHDRLSGNVSLGHALETFAQGSGPGAGIASLYRARLEGAKR